MCGSASFVSAAPALMSALMPALMEVKLEN